MVFTLPWGFPGGSDSKESSCSVGDPGLILGLGRSPGEGQGNPLQYSCLENPHGQRSLVGYSPCGHKELNTTEQLKIFLFFFTLSWLEMLKVVVVFNGVIIMLYIQFYVPEIAVFYWVKALCYRQWLWLKLAH